MPALNPEHVLFDCDGVIVDSEVLATRAFITALQPFGYQADTHSHTERFAGIVNRDVIAELSDELGISPFHRVWSEVGRLFEHYFEHELQPVAGMPDLIRGLPVPASVVSNSHPEHILMAIKAANLDPLDTFGGRIFSANNVARPKPAPDVYLRALQSNSLDARRAAVVEDSPTGVRAAKAAGLRVIGLCAAGHIPAGHDAKLRREGADAIAFSAAEVADMLFG